MIGLSYDDGEVQQMRAVRYHQHGGPEVLQLEEVPAPVLTGGQVLVEVEAIGANVIDTVFRRGDGPWTRPLPGKLTGDVVGRITALGPDTPAELRTGQRVAALSEDAFAEQVAADAAWLAPVAEDADAGQATMLSMTAPLALRLLKTAKAGADDAVLIQSAAGTVGHLAVQLARALGVKTVIGTASSPAKLDFIRACGADLAVDLSDADWPDRIRELTPQGVDVVLDAVGGKVFDQGLDLLAPLGRMVSYGAISGELPVAPIQSLFQLKSVTGLSMLAWRAARPAEAYADIAEVTRLFAAGDLRPRVHGTYPLADIAELHTVLDSRANLGRLIATTQ
ncbi:quinone oxidoreductase family protein [Kribbella monticola]|uniref:quinone oxidoreductase family protein n=1 Tax=Kribbella monticola TaxID=2185285 RepID=UPI0018E4DC51|nr:zinc-binding dehydrogenase [Kribbella monticola]